MNCELCGLDHRVVAPDRNCLQKQIEQLQKSIPVKYKEGFINGLKEYAWWKDGVQYVGSCGTTLKKAIEEVLKGR